MKSAPNPTNLIGNNIASVRKRISEAALQCGRQPESIQLLAVSKTRPADFIRAASDYRQVDFGENYIKEAHEKIAQLRDLPLNWHFIGQIQSNKTALLATHFSWIHTLSSLKAARRLHDQSQDRAERLKVLIQINVSRDPAKNGLLPEGLFPFLDSLLSFDNLALRGLMTLPAFSESRTAQQTPFRQLRELLESARDKYGSDLAEFDQLSMGMSQDMEAAIAQGATWVRIGTDLFGARNSGP